MAEDPAVVAAFSDRHHGNLSFKVGAGDPMAARSAWFSELGLSADDAVYMEQVHGRAVASVMGQDRGRGALAAGSSVPGVDGLVTHDLDVPLVVLVADCVPVVLVDPGKGVAVAHAGRRGIAEGIVQATVMQLCPGERTSVVAVLGPAIGGCCYELPDSVAEPFWVAWPNARATTQWGTASVDLPAAVTAILLEAGITRLRPSPGCTSCERERWFSHRAAPGAGRQAGVVVRRAARAHLPTPNPVHF